MRAVARFGCTVAWVKPREGREERGTSDATQHGSADENVATEAEQMEERARNVDRPLLDGASPEGAHSAATFWMATARGPVMTERSGARRRAATPA